ncbi:MAG: BPL-N domain-containing protein [Bacillota bacterium]
MPCFKKLINKEVSYDKPDFLKMLTLIIATASLLLLVSCSLEDNSRASSGSDVTGDIENAEKHQEQENEKETKSEAPGEPETIKDDYDPDQSKDNALAEPKTVPTVIIYNGSGSWSENVETFQDFFDNYNIKYDLADEQRISEPGLLELYEIIVFPGGGAADYRYEIPGHDNIRSFVEDGGLFIGFCAGAYYAADIFNWQGNEYDYPLGIFEGSSIGPLTGKVAWGDIARLSLNPDHPANDKFDSKLDISYYDGPFFKPHNLNEENDNTIEILARYDVNDQPAVIAGRFGEGAFLLFGPHPEMDGHEKNEGANWAWLYSSLLWFTDW